MRKLHRACWVKGTSPNQVARDSAVITAGKFIFVLHMSHLIHQISVHCLCLGVYVQLTAGQTSCHCLGVSVLCQGKKINNHLKGFIFGSLLQVSSKCDSSDTPGTRMCCRYKKLKHLGILRSISNNFKIALFL